MGKYQALGQGLYSGAKISSGFRQAREQKAHREEVGTARAAAVEGGLDSEAMKSFIALDPAEAKSLVDIFGTLSETQQKAAKARNDVAGSLMGHLAEATDQADWQRRAAIIKSEFIDSGKLDSDLARMFPDPADPQGFDKTMANAATLVETDKLMDYVLKSRLQATKTGDSLKLDKAKTANAIQKDTSKNRLDTKLEEKKYRNKSDLQSQKQAGDRTSARESSDLVDKKHRYSTTEQKQKHSDRIAAAKVEGAGKVRPTKDINKLVRTVSKQYEKIEGEDGYGDAVETKRDPADMRKFQRTMKRYIAEGMGEFEAEEKAAAEVFGQQTSKAGVRKYNPATGNIE